MKIVIDKLVEVLSTSPESILSLGSLGVKKPSGASDIPTIVISIIIENNKGTGIGRFMRSGDSVVQNTSVIEVKHTSDTFSSDLKYLRIWPLPLKKNPSTTEKKFTENDIQLRNVTDTNNIINYKMTDKPSQENEYGLDLPRAMIIFGKSQTHVEMLEIVHWTMAWRDEILGDRYNGSMSLDVWAGSSNETDEISQRLQDKLKSNRTLLRQKGFLKFQPASLGPVENLSIDPPVGSTFSAWKQELGYKFAFEIEEGGELSSGIPIKQIDVDMNKHLVESFSIP